MTHGVAAWVGSRARTLSSLSGALSNALGLAGPSLLFGLRLWASVCLALFVAFWLELDSAFWAGTSAAIVCAPQLGASLRKGWFRLIGSLIGATMIVVLTACFPQDRIAFLGLLTLWGAGCAFAATVLRNFASYGAALAGFTAAVIAADTLGATGGTNSTVFMLAVSRASEILYWHRVRRHRSRGDRSRRGAAAARRLLRHSGGGDNEPVYRHAGASGTKNA
jgi:uncharacterized membrane protein YccC